MSSYSNCSNLLRGLSKDNAEFVRTDNSEDDKIERSGPLYLHHYPLPNGDYSFNDQNYLGSYPYGYSPSAQYSANGQQFVGLQQFDPTSGYEYPQMKQTIYQNNGLYSKEANNQQLADDDDDKDEDLNDFEKSLQGQEVSRQVTFEVESSPDNLPEPEDSESDYEPGAKKKKQKNGSVKRVQRRKIMENDQKKDVPLPTNMKPFDLEKRSDYVPRTKARNYRLKSVEEKMNDPLYMLKRDKNNDAVRRSRKRSRQVELERKEQFEVMQRENKWLKAEVLRLRSAACINCGQKPIKLENEDNEEFH
ncbi:hypothetical protein B9Z55_003944 [Caenorhabditis nigoni]|uniref:BZIP domain-containing protein n=2 Tax=Caenorhabditis nigoni TaxID=1611254 RepID=A0A2G5VTA7_9PELO|nr:hypothetical protein B9Z55_003944 [Caenorhabditis nigoni]